MSQHGRLACSAITADKIAHGVIGGSVAAISINEPPKETDLFDLINVITTAVQDIAISADEINSRLFGPQLQVDSSNSTPSVGMKEKLYNIGLIVTNARETLNVIQRRIGTD